METVTAIASGVAAVVAAWAAWSAHRAAAQTRDLVTIERERWEQDRAEQRHARFVLHAERQPSDREGFGDRVYLVARNRGPAAARGLTLTFEGDAPRMIAAAHVFPMAFVPVDGMARVPVTLRWGGPSTGEVVATWTDDAGEQRETYSVSFI